MTKSVFRVVLNEFEDIKKHQQKNLLKIHHKFVSSSSYLTENILI